MIYDTNGKDWITYNADCFDAFGLLGNASVHLVLSDPPYGTTACKWDTPLDLPRMWQEYARLCRPKAPSVLFAAQPFTSVLVVSNIKNYRYAWTWKKPKGTGHLNAKKQPLRDTEDIAVFCNESAAYSPQFRAGTPYKAERRGRDKEHMTYGKNAGTREDNDGRRYPKTTLEFGVVEQGTEHPTQKPVDLLRYLVRTYTQPGDVVLDNTMGSGSTGVAALMEGRKFIGMERDVEYGYYAIAVRRLKEVSP